MEQRRQLNNRLLVLHHAFHDQLWRHRASTSVRSWDREHRANDRNAISGHSPRASRNS